MKKERDYTTITVKFETYEYIVSHGKFGESIETVLRKLLNLPSLSEVNKNEKSISNKRKREDDSSH